MAAGDVEVSIATPDARQCAKFDGVDDTINCGNKEAFNQTSSITLSCWVMFKTVPATIQRLMNKKKGDGVFGGYDFQKAANGKFGFGIFNASDVSSYIQSTTTAQANTRYLVTATYDGTNQQIYVNGVWENSKVATNILTAGVQTLSIGSIWDTYEFLNGTIYNVSIYNRALSAAEVAKLYGGIHITDGLVGYWPLKTDYLDYSGEGNSGTNSGSILVTSDGPVAKAIADKRVNSSDRYFAIDVNGGSQIVAGRIQEA